MDEPLAYVGSYFLHIAALYVGALYIEPYIWGPYIMQGCSGPVRVRVLIFPVRVFPSGPGFNFSGPVRSGFQKNSGPGFHFRSGFCFFPVRSGPGFIFDNIFCL